MKIFRTSDGIFVQQDSRFYPVPAEDWDDLFCDRDIAERASRAISGAGLTSLNGVKILSPAKNQDVWAAGVTYYRSRSARIDESKAAGGSEFYERVYDAARPELFFKSTGPRSIGPGGPIRVRADAEWSVPEPELTLAISPAGRIFGYTIGNDVSSRDIEGENPLYLPQAKVYDGSCALGPCILLSPDPLPRTAAISLEVRRGSQLAFAGSTTLAELKRDPLELVEYLYRENSFASGAFLMTGTGIVPGDEVSLAHGDLVRITIDGIGTLENVVS